MEKYVIKYNKYFVRIYKDKTDGEVYAGLVELKYASVFDNVNNVRRMVGWLNSFEPISDTYIGFVYTILNDTNPQYNNANKGG